MDNKYFKKPILINPTRPSAGPDIAFVDISEFSRRMGSNTGNMAFLHALILTIDGLKHITKRSFQEADIKVWGCSNFINPKSPRKVTNSPIYTDGKPIVLVGLGAQAPDLQHDLIIDEDTLTWLSTLANMSMSDKPNITLRGDYTYNLLKKYNLHTKCIVLGCPSLFINPDNKLGSQIIKPRLNKDFKTIGVAPGNIGHLNDKFIDIERYMVKLVDENCGSYICQSNINIFSIMFDNYENIDKSFLTKLKKDIKPELKDDEMYCWLRKHGKVFDNIPSWLNHLRSLDLVVSTRIHGAQLALQAGTPAICIALDSRQIELCRIMHIPYIEWSKFDSNQDLEYIIDFLRSFDWDAYDNNRRRLAFEFRRFLNNNSLSSTDHLNNIINV